MAESRPYTQLGTALQNARNSVHLSQRDLAQRANVSKSLISQAEEGIKNLGLKARQKIIGALVEAGCKEDLLARLDIRASATYQGVIPGKLIEPPPFGFRSIKPNSIGYVFTVSESASKNYTVVCDGALAEFRSLNGDQRQRFVEFLLALSTAVQHAPVNISNLHRLAESIARGPSEVEQWLREQEGEFRCATVVAVALWFSPGRIPALLALTDPVLDWPISVLPVSLTETMLHDALHPME